MARPKGIDLGTRISVSLGGNRTVSLPVYMVKKDEGLPSFFVEHDACRVDSSNPTELQGLFEKAWESRATLDFQPRMAIVVSESTDKTGAVSVTFRFSNLMVAETPEGSRFVRLADGKVASYSGVLVPQEAGLLDSADMIVAINDLLGI